MAQAEVSADHFGDRFVSPRCYMKKISLRAISLFAVIFTIQVLALALAGSQRPVRVLGTGTQATITVRLGDNLQAAIDEAHYGDTVVLEAGATFVGPLHLRNKGAGSGGDADFITIRTSDLSGISREGERINPPLQARSMPKIVSPNQQAAVTSDPQAHHYKFIGIEFAPASNAKYVYNLIDLGQSDYTSLTEFPHHLVFDRCYVHATGLNTARRGFALNSAETSIVNSYVSGFAGAGDETQAISGWNGPGPFHIVNNFLQAGAEVVLFGGSDPSITNLVPSDIEFRGNYLTRLNEWAGHATIKGTFELKNARRVRVEGNLIESEILTTAMVLTPRNQNGKAPWSSVEDVEIVNNIVRHASTGINILGTDNEHQSQELRRLRIANNLFIDLTPDDPNNTAYFVQVEGTDSVLIEHNTVQQKGDMLRSYGRPPRTFTFRDNVIQHNAYGIICLIEGGRCFPSDTIKGNVMVDNLNVARQESLEKKYPGGNYFPGSLDAVGFVDYKSGNWRLASGSRYRGKATDGTDPGVNFDKLSVEGAEKVRTGLK
jgi:hypothetical protein